MIPVKEWALQFYGAKSWSRKHPGIWLITMSLAGMLCASFFLLTSEVNEARAGFDETIGWIDVVSHRFLVENRQSQFNVAMIYITDLGSGFALALYLLFGSAVLGMHRRRFEIAYLFVAGLGSLCLINFLKFHFVRSRPDVASWLVHANGYSYPSGHALGSSAVFCALAIVVSNGLGIRTSIFAFLLAALCYAMVAFSRVYLGVHYFSDVIAGGLLGASWALFAWGCFSFAKQAGSFPSPQK